MVTPKVKLTGIAVLCFLCAGLYAGTLFSYLRTRAHGPTSTVSFRESEINFGRVGQNERLKGIAYLENRSSEPIQIVAVETSCQCTTTPDDLLGKVVEPRDVLAVPCVLSTGASDDDIVSRLTLSFRSLGQVESEEVRLRAKVIPEVWLDSTSVNLGIVADDKPQEFSGKLHSQKKLARILAASSDSPFFSAAIGQTGEEYSIKFTPPASLQPVAYRSIIRFSTNSPRVPKLELFVQATVRPALTVTPSSLVFMADQESAPPPPATFLITSVEPTRIMAVHSLPPHCQARFQADSPSKSHQVTIEFGIGRIDSAAVEDRSIQIEVQTDAEPTTFQVLRIPLVIVPSHPGKGSSSLLGVKPRQENLRSRPCVGRC
ncbi:MAG: hypothetical protein ACR2FY_15895 [Pirellulaceae bacterium]